MLQFRSICTTAVRHSRISGPIIKKFPVTLRISLPDFDHLTSHRFTSFDNIADFLAPKNFLVDPLGNAIHIDQLEDIDPSVVYYLVGPGWTHRQKGLSRDQVVDRVFEQKAAFALRAILEKEDPGFTELPRVIKDKDGTAIAEWEAVFQSSDGCVIFLEAKFRMSLSHVNEQPKRMSKSLRAMGKSRAKLYLAAYYWHDDIMCVSFTRSQGYGIIQPNDRDVSIKVMASEQQL